MIHPHNQGLCIPDCFGCKVQGFGIASKALPTRRSRQNESDRFAEQTMKDVEAYKRLRADGLQPKGTKGAARTEALATTRFEVENNYIIRHKRLAQTVDNAQADIRSAVAVPLEPAES